MFEDVKITQDELVPDLVREIKLAEEDASQNLPAIVIHGAYLKRDKFRMLLKPFLNKKEPTEADEGKFREAVVNLCWRDWSGVTLRNLTRVSEFVMLNYDQLVQAFTAKGADGDTPIEFVTNDVKWVAKKLNNEIHQKLIDELVKMEDYATQKQELEKKD